MSAQVWQRPMTRADLMHIARVYVIEAGRRRGDAFAHTLLTWAGNARRRAMREARQTELFS